MKIYRILDRSCYEGEESEEEDEVEKEEEGEELRKVEEEMER